MNAIEIETTAIALLNGAGWDDKAGAFCGVLNGLSPDEMRAVVVELVGVWRGTVRGLAVRHGEDDDQLLGEILSSLGAYAAAKS